MKIALFGENVNSIRPAVETASCDIVEKDPDFVLSYGGDGTFLKSERVYPGVPKVLLRNSPTCQLCTEYPVDEVLSRIKFSDYGIFEIQKLQAQVRDITWTALNDVVVHNANPRYALRFNVRADDIFLRDVIGDGIVVATSFGSTGYFKSITKKTFQKGIGVAFNNSSTFVEPMILEEKDFSLRVVVTRGPGLLYVDNQDEEVPLEDGDEVTISLSKEKARVLTFD